MKFTVDRSDFHKAITKIEGIISAREIRSVISNILIETDGDRTVLTATDLEMGIKTSIPVEVQEAGTITLPAKKLSQSVREFRGARINIESDDDHKVNIHDASGVSKARITIMGASSEEYPKIPTLPDKQYVQFPAGLALDMIRKTSHSIAEEDARYVFNGLYIINKENRVAFVATDGRRLAKIEREFPEELPFQAGIILPNKAVRELHKLMDSESEGKVAFVEKDRRVYFRFGNVDLIAKLIEGQFPDYEQVIPQKLDQCLLINRTSFENSIRQVSVMAAEPSRQIKLTFSPGSINVMASTPDLGEARDSMDSDYAGEEVTVGFNSNYLQDVIRALTIDDFALSFSSSNAPAVISDPNDPDFISVIMPMKI